MFVIEARAAANLPRRARRAAASSCASRAPSCPTWSSLCTTRSKRRAHGSLLARVDTEPHTRGPLSHHPPPRRHLPAQVNKELAGLPKALAGDAALELQALAARVTEALKDAQEARPGSMGFMQRRARAAAARRGARPLGAALRRGGADGKRALTLTPRRARPPVRTTRTLRAAASTAATRRSAQTSSRRTPTSASAAARRRRARLAAARTTATSQTNFGLRASRVRVCVGGARG